MSVLALGLIVSLVFAEDSLLVKNANVISFDPSTEGATAVATRNGRIVAVGDESTCREAAGTAAIEVDAGGRPLLRGFFDAHCHLMNGGLASLQLDLRGCRSIEEMVERVNKWRVTLPIDEWIVGRGWDHTLFPGQKWPTRDPFDEIAPNGPMFLERIDGHSALVNGAALRVAEIDEATEDPSNGLILRDELGQPNGILKEGAVDLVERLIPPRTFERKLSGLRRAVELATRFGLTSCADHGGDPDVYLELKKRGELTCRIDLWLDLTDDLSVAIETRKKLEPAKEWIRFNTLKGFVDGTFGSRTAAMFEPFHDDASTSGVVATDLDVLRNRVIAADAAGFQVALHAIGDRAVSIALDCFASAAQANGPRERRHRVEHAQVLRAEEIARFAELGVTASVQPCHLLTDRRFAVDRIGNDRAKTSYPWRALTDAGALLAFGTDYNVESLDPMRNLFAAITRGSEDNASEPAYFAEQCLTLDEALRAMTLGPAKAAFRDVELGPLAVGTLADFVILRDPLDAKDPRAMLENRAWLVVCDGRVVFRDS